MSRMSGRSSMSGVSYHPLLPVVRVVRVDSSEGAEGRACDGLEHSVVLVALVSAYFVQPRDRPFRRALSKDTRRREAQPFERGPIGGGRIDGIVIAVVAVHG